MAEIVATNIVASRPPNGDRLQRRRSCQLNSQRLRSVVVVTAPSNSKLSQQQKLNKFNR